MIGHNEPPERLERIRVIRVHINDWVASTRGLSLEEEGFFWRFTLLQYDRMGSVADNDLLNARALNIDVRIYKRLKQRLLEAGKIRIEFGLLTHPRIVREIEMYVAEHKRRSAAAKEREQGKHNTRIVEDMHPTSGIDQANFQDNSGGSPEEVQEKSTELPAQLPAQVFQKPSNNNVCAATTVPTGPTQASRAPAFPKPKPISKEDPHKPPKGGDPLLGPFEEFWKAFPEGRKVGKGDALDIFRKIVTDRHRKKLHAKASEIVDGARRYARTKPDPEFVPKPTTWLNDGRWQDDQGTTQAETIPWWQNPAKLALATPEKWPKWVESHANGHWPVDKLGPTPGTDECVVPEGVISDLRLLERYDENGVERASWKSKLRDA